MIHEVPDGHHRIVATDEPDHDIGGGAHHEYEVRAASGEVLHTISFQHGPEQEHGENGVQHADLLAIVRHRLECFQAGPYASIANEVTAGFVSGAMGCDAARTRQREEAGIEGTSAKVRVDCRRDATAEQGEGTPRHPAEDPPGGAAGAPPWGPLRGPPGGPLRGPLRTNQSQNQIQRETDRCQRRFFGIRSSSWRRLSRCWSPS